MAKERSRIADRMDAGLGESTKHANIVICVNRGGTNSYYEAMRYAMRPYGKRPVPGRFTHTAIKTEDRSE